MLTLFVVLAVAALLFVAAVVATQDSDVLADAPPDGPDVELPTGQVVAEDLRSVRFGMVFRGYRMSQVDEVLDRLAGELAERDERIADLEQVLAEIVEPVVAEAESQRDLAGGDVPDVPEAPEAPEAPAPVPGPLPDVPAVPVEDAGPVETSAPGVGAEPASQTHSSAERALDLAASYRLGGLAAGVPSAAELPVPPETDRPSGHADVEPEDDPPQVEAPPFTPAPETADTAAHATEPLEPSVSEILTDAAPEEPPSVRVDAAAVDVEQDDLDAFPEVAPAEPAVPGLPEAWEQTGRSADDGGEAWRSPPSQEP